MNVLRMAIVFGVPVLFPALTYGQSCTASSKYTNCNEEMPVDLQLFQSEICKAKGLAPGKDCLNAYDQWFEESLQKNKPDDYEKYMNSKRLQDSGDSQACIRYLNGVLKRPREAFLNRTQEISGFIKETAMYYGVPPEAIVCAIGGDATTTSGSYPDQSKYENPMIQQTPIQEALRDLNSKGLMFARPHLMAV